MSEFWKHYARANDDIRHKLIEEGWFGRPVTGNIEEKPAPSTTLATPGETTTGAVSTGKHAHWPLYEQIWGKAPEHAEIYGAAPAVSQASEIKPAEAPPQSKGLEPDL